MINDTLKMLGTLNILHTDVSGNIISNTNLKNLVVALGKNFMASRMKDATTTAMSHMALGTGTLTANASDTALTTPLGSRVALTSTTVVNNTISYVATFGPGVCTGNITEAAIFNALTSGTMLNRVVFTSVPKSAGDTIIITWNVTIQ